MKYINPKVIEKFCKEKNITLREFCKLAEINFCIFRAHLNDEFSGIPLSYAIKISKTIGITIDEILLT